MNARNGRRIGRLRDELIESELIALSGPLTPALIQQPQARNVPEQPKRSRDTALVGQVRRERVVADHRVIDLDADERPRADAQKDRAVIDQRRRRDCRGGVVSRNRNHARIVEAGGFRRIARERAEQRSRRHDLLEQPVRNVEPVEEIGRPASSRRVVALRGRGVCELGRPAAAQQEVEEIGDHEQRARRVERLVAFTGHCRQLEDRVDRQKLDSGALVQLARRHALEDAFDRSRPAGVAIVPRCLDDRTLVVEEGEVDRPRVDCERIDGRIATGGSQSVEDVSVQLFHVPVERAGTLDRIVGKPVDLIHLELGAVEPSDGDTPALCAEIDGGHGRH